MLNSLKTKAVKWPWLLNHMSFQSAKGVASITYDPMFSVSMIFVSKVLGVHIKCLKLSGAITDGR